ncbi:MAG: hypothetical protein OXM56_13955 [Gammaproteobacteria bacterium]|nr:hypothetical protein [Gammaproteobacteria bacterium]
MSDSISTGPKASFQWKTVTTLGAATWLVTSQLAGCSPEDGAPAEGEGEGESTLTQPLVGGEGEGGEGEGGEGEGGEGEGGEGEGGEGEGGATVGADFATNDVAYLTQLGLIRGHLAVGYALYQHDLPELSETHMKHPREEIYAAVVPAFAARGCDGFADGLTALTQAVVDRAEAAEVTAVYEALTTAIGRCEQTAATGDPAVMAKVIEQLLRTAGVEYQIGVVDGAIDNLHEYQDAWGFTEVAAMWSRSAAFGATPAATAVAGQIQDVIVGLDGLWPSLAPDGAVDGDAAQLFGAAGGVEVAALPLSQER